MAKIPNPVYRKTLEFYLFYITTVYSLWGGFAQLIVCWSVGQGVPGSSPARVAVRYGLEQVTFPQLNVCIYMFICSLLVGLRPWELREMDELHSTSMHSCALT